MLDALLYHTVEVACVGMLGKHSVVKAMALASYGGIAPCLRFQHTSGRADYVSRAGAYVQIEATILCVHGRIPSGCRGPMLV